jgi:methylmalonyl-CoA/ethylmalonyl-CoA epimerase
VPTFKRIDHVVLSTTDMADAVAKWERNLDLRVEEQMSRPLGAAFDLALLPVGDAFLELLQSVEKEGRIAELVKERGEGLFSMSIEVDDLDGAVGHLRSKGAEVSDPEQGIWPGSRVARVTPAGTHGVLMQLIERR